ncbi:MAG: GNAT family N-acetyltransferase [Microbacteriaceae bacterium]
MVSFREADVSDPAATVLLNEYFEHRAFGFPKEQGTYVTVLPRSEDFLAPTGVFVIAEGENLAGEEADVGCGGIRRIAGLGNPDTNGSEESATTFEVKHLWVRPHVRRTGVGRALVAELEERARLLGATELVLDTNDSLEAAGGLYLASGFSRIEPYNTNPNATAWYRKVLN